MRKGINIWSFAPGLGLSECMELAKRAGFEGIELALAARGPVNLTSTKAELAAVRNMARNNGLCVSSLATGLYWQYSLTSDRADIREMARHVVRKQIDAAAALGTDCALVCPGMVGADFRPEEVVPDAGDISFFAGSEVIGYDTAYERAQDALAALAPYASERGVVIGVENIWNKFLLSPLEMRRFLDETGSPFVRAYLDVGNTVLFGYPEHWIRILAERIKRVHFKDYRRDAKGLAGFVDLLAGDVDWVGVYEALSDIGYEGWANAEMCPTYRQYTDQMIWNASAAMDRILRRA
ncbi:MAG: sugar phosphate isomerase/epimerase [Clostridiales bacterium]|nr:sugar phosphate isomerase/epimerase [Clostridiales bacterium]